MFLPDDTKDYIANVMEESYAKSEEAYKHLLEEGIPPEIARDVLSNGLKTDIVITYNLRQWREFFRQRTAEVAHPEMREITLPLLERFKKLGLWYHVICDSAHGFHTYTCIEPTQDLQKVMELLSLTMLESYINLNHGPCI